MGAIFEFDYSSSDNTRHKVVIIGFNCSLMYGLMALDNNGSFAGTYWVEPKPQSTNVVLEFLKNKTNVKYLGQAVLTSKI